ncbi:MAG TPA: gliding motility-associated C-terminal domain-containing protein [Bacteroidia bacterium]|nr:gliding motility-associated C-terminal domain-containing protein [Bacteroidia bacterium]
MKWVCFLISILVSFFAKSQTGKEACNWAFDKQCSLNFSSGSPVINSDCMLTTEEGSASISDRNTGQLLFYTDGNWVYNRNNQLMPNGDSLSQPSFSSTQAALIVPKPGSANLYYLISADAAAYSAVFNSSPYINIGVKYAIIDMNLQGGLGDVVVKRKTLTPPITTEKLTGARHCNGKDFWILTHPFNSNAFNAYLLTENGLDTIPVTSNTGTIQQNISGTNLEAAGYMKISPNGKKLALAVTQPTAFIEIFDFDNSTGKVSNPHKITYNFSLNNQYSEPYGIAFSPDNTKLYTNMTTQNVILQYDLNVFNDSAIKASETIIINRQDVWSLQLGPDGKIYIACNSSNCLDVINLPNKKGTLCNYISNAISFNTPAEVRVGLPNFIDAYTTNNIPKVDTTIELCKVNNYSLAIPVNNTSCLWSTNDTTMNIYVNNFGKYWVSSLNKDGCLETDTFQLIQTTPDKINILRDITRCDIYTVDTNISVYYNNTVSYLWNNIYTGQNYTLTAPGFYWVDFIMNNSCVSRDSFLYTYYKKNLLINLPNIVTPNNDGVNDFIDFGKYQFSSMLFEVFNRWGEKIFESEDSIIIWKPECIDGTYFYTLQYKVDCGTETQSKSLKGFITIVR